MRATRSSHARADVLSQLTNNPDHLWRDKYTALSGPLAERARYKISKEEVCIGAAKIRGGEVPLSSEFSENSQGRILALA